MPGRSKPLVWLQGAVKTPPFSKDARIEAGVLLRQLQDSVHVGMPHSRPMPAIGTRCHELRIQDANVTWRIVYRGDPDAVVILEVFNKKTRLTPKTVIDTCKQRLREYDAAVGRRKKR
jgi:phage-related protein